MAVLTIYDITGIQDFIFGSNKLKENIGASYIVAELFEKYLPEFIASKTEKAYVHWKEQDEFYFLSDQAADAEIIYIGGGNAVVIYRDHNIRLRVNEELSKKVLQLTEGQLGVVSACIETDLSDFMQDRKILFEELKKSKNLTSRTIPMLGIGITRQGITDNLPASVRENDDYISTPAYSKRQEAKKNSYNKYKFPLDLEELGQQEGESHIAVVHIDGNNMGKKLEGILSSTPDYRTSVKLIREFSSKVDELYKDTFDKMLDEFLGYYHNVKNAGLKDRIRFNDGVIPVRPIVLNGDDVTFVCDGRLGINLAEIFLKKLPKSLDIKGREMAVSACAGISVVKTKFPFYRAYEIAEELCSSAKAKGKIIAENMGAECASWLDFHISQSGITSSIEKIRQSDYVTPGMSKAKDIQSEANDKLIYKQYNLLWRPWVLGDNAKDEYNWEKLRMIFREFNCSDEESGWGRSSLKALRNAFIESEQSVMNVVKQKKSRKKELPVFTRQLEHPFAYRNETGTILNQTPYFDALEILDFYFYLEGDNEANN